VIFGKNFWFLISKSFDTDICTFVSATEVRVLCYLLAQYKDT